MHRVITRVWSQISAGSSASQWISLFHNWLSKFLSCQSKDLIHQNKKSLMNALTKTKQIQIKYYVYLVKSHSDYQKWSCSFFCFHLQDIEPLAKTVVQRVKLCGQILCHLSKNMRRQWSWKLCGDRHKYWWEKANSAEAEERKKRDHTGIESMTMRATIVACLRLRKPFMLYLSSMWRSTLVSWTLIWKWNNKQRRIILWRVMCDLLAL